ncbi:hypothetical protein BWGOE6_34170 [Bacillus mycoides]|uniref:MBL fold metallo-hydrolase n=1 Tax=Bacillus mycoides TaxID=1405 RepID=UPI0008727A95|nr:MBL fold metallo-hydrolase [Bacillus mycoides]OFD57652.1 hypothetical protein BWGOE6_34170 [Bacillus mycoides]
MNNFVCTTCGVQYAASVEEPISCLICDEERQYINPKGQSWTTLENLQTSDTYKNEMIEEENGLYSITTKPEFAIGQTAFVVKTESYRLLWDCITYLDETTVEQIKEWGGLDAIALSHPHYYSTQVEWAETFDVPIYIHEDDQEWVMRPSSRIIYWTGESLRLADGITVHRLGGHFSGGSVLHWEEGNDGKGILLTGDIIQVVADQQWVSFMYSYPNLIPLPARKVEEMANRVKPLQFNRLYNAFNRVVKENANEAVERSAERYMKAIEGKLFHT